MLKFEIEKRDGLARVGKIITPNGEIKTPHMLSLEGRFDFVLQIDPIEEKFIPMLQCEDVPEPIELTEESVDILVFRNKFECYRSKHYHQEPKAWLWM